MQTRKETISVKIGNILIGSKHPIRVQSMTNTDTSNVEATYKQVMELYDAGSEMVRITVDNEESAKSVSKIKSMLLQKNCTVPLIGDFHFNGHILLSKYPETASALDKFRINPGNIGGKDKFDANFVLSRECI